MTDYHRELENDPDHIQSEIERLTTRLNVVRYDARSPRDHQEIKDIKIEIDHLKRKQGEILQRESNKDTDEDQVAYCTGMNPHIGNPPDEDNEITIIIKGDKIGFRCCKEAFNVNASLVQPVVLAKAISALSRQLEKVTGGNNEL